MNAQSKIHARHKYVSYLNSNPPYTSAHAAKHRRRLFLLQQRGAPVVHPPTPQRHLARSAVTHLTRGRDRIHPKLPLQDLQQRLLAAHLQLRGGGGDDDDIGLSVLLLPRLVRSNVHDGLERVPPRGVRLEGLKVDLFRRDPRRPRLPQRLVHHARGPAKIKPGIPRHRLEDVRDAEPLAGRLVVDGGHTAAAAAALAAQQLADAFPEGDLVGGAHGQMELGVEVEVVQLLDHVEKCRDADAAGHEDVAAGGGDEGHRGEPPDLQRVADLRLLVEVPRSTAAPRLLQRNAEFEPVSVARDNRVRTHKRIAASGHVHGDLDLRMRAFVQLRVLDLLRRLENKGHDPRRLSLLRYHLKLPPLLRFVLLVRLSLGLCLVLRNPVRKRIMALLPKRRDRRQLLVHRHVARIAVQILLNPLDRPRRVRSLHQPDLVPGLDPTLT